VCSDNRVARNKWWAQGWVLEDDIKRVVGFVEPLMGYHGTQRFQLLARDAVGCCVRHPGSADVGRAPLRVQWGAQQDRYVSVP
jgi:hypothetical protein